MTKLQIIKKAYNTAKANNESWACAVDSALKEAGYKTAHQDAYSETSDEDVIVIMSDGEIITTGDIATS